jgi:hypothetical protein
MLMGAIIAAILPFVPTLIAEVERLFSKPKSGEDKMDAIVQSLRAVITKLIATDPTIKAPSDQEIQAVVETVFQQQKQAVPAPVASASAVPILGGSIYILRGSVTPI